MADPQYFNVPKILVREPRLMIPGQKPVGRVRVDNRKYKITNWITLPSATDLVTGEVSSIYNTYNVETLPDSIKSNNGNRRYSANTINLSGGSAAKTIVVVCKMTQNESSTYGQLYLQGSEGIVHITLSKTKIAAWVEQDYSLTITKNPSLSTDDIGVVVLGSDGGNNVWVRAYCKGVLVGEGSRTITGIGNFNTYGVFSYWGFSKHGYPTYHRMLDWYMIDTPFSESLAASIGSDPYQFLIPA